jgi:hypothetical protein
MGQTCCILHVFAMVAGLRLADMVNNKQPNTFLRGFGWAEREAALARTRLDKGKGGLGLVSKRYPTRAITLTAMMVWGQQEMCLRRATTIETTMKVHWQGRRQ